MLVCIFRMFLAVTYIFAESLADRLEELKEPRSMLRLQLDVLGLPTPAQIDAVSPHLRMRDAFCEFCAEQEGSWAAEEGCTSPD